MPAAYRVVGRSMVAVEERRVKIVRTTKTHRGKRYRDYYLKIHLPEYIAEKVDHYLARIDTETGRITLEPVPRSRGEES